MNVPVLTRTACFRKLRDGSIQHMDFNLVATTLGGMIEPRTLYRDGSAIKNDDVYDSNYTDMRVLDETEIAFYWNTPLSAVQWPKVYNTL